MQAEELFIQKHKTQNIAELALSLSKQPDLDKDFILRQINGWQKAKQKLPEWAAVEALLYPPPISMEQCSSERTAKFKASLFQGESLIDLTGGFGVDSYYFAQSFKEVHYVEPYRPLFEVVRHNFELLHAKNITPHLQTAESFIAEQQAKHFSACYIDPSRRDEGKKVFLLADCQPNIVELSKEIFGRCPTIIIKTSPLLDIKQSIIELGNVSAVHVVALQNECKELLFVMQKDFRGAPTIATHNLSTNKEEHFTFNYGSERKAAVTYSNPKTYIYEPNAAILKAGAFKQIAVAFGLEKIAPNSHLYTSEELIETFPGRKFKLQQQLPYQAKAFRKLGIQKANVSVRNFKASVEQIRKKLKLKAGGALYIFATTLENKHSTLLLTEKV